MVSISIIMASRAMLGIIYERDRKRMVSLNFSKSCVSKQQRSVFATAVAGSDMTD